MKKTIWLLSILLLLTACAAPARDVPPAQSVVLAESAESAPAGSAPEEEFPNPGGQQMAIEAYEAIMEYFGAGTLPGVPAYEWYPGEFADAYIGEDNFLYVCLTDISEEMLSHYRGLVPDYRILSFVEVEHSYEELWTLQDVLTDMEGLEFSMIGIDVMENLVKIGIPEITKEAEARGLIEEQLPLEIKELFEELPITFEEQEYLSLT